MDRFWSKVDRSGNCWMWTGGQSKGGYGIIYFEGKYWRANRLAWVLSRGSIPDGMVICHKCDNPPCVRPDHLFLGTMRDNQRDMAVKGRANGHFIKHPPRAENNVKAKLTWPQVRHIRAEYAAGEIQKSLAEKYGVSQVNISAIVRGATWAA